MLSCTAQKKLFRLGRRSGKTAAMVIEALHHMIINRNHTVLVIAPFERQVTHIFDEMKKLLDTGINVRGSIARDIKTPSRLELKNGSKALGFSAGAQSGDGSAKVRGQDADLIVIDEIDTLADPDIDAVLAILASHAHCKLIAASTPRGWRRRFYTYVTNKDLGYKEFWHIGSESPEWTQETEDFFRGSMDEATYGHEILAEFAELEEGVFKKKHLNKCIQSYDMSEITPNDRGTYVLGIDWNKSAGTHMTIVQWTGGRLKLVRKIVIPEGEYLQTESVEEIIKLHSQWNFKYIFLDIGYGSTQYEMIKKYGVNHSRTNLHRITFPVHMNQSIEIRDPVTGERIKKPAKPFIVQQTAKLMEDGKLLLPKSEDTNVSSGDVSMGLVQQMRNYMVVNYSIYGLPRYSQGQDHTLTAYMLACAGFVLEAGDLKNVAYDQSIFGVPSEVVQEKKPNYVAPSSFESEKKEMIEQGFILRHTTAKPRIVDGKKTREVDFGKPRRNIGSSFRRRKF
ncbi:MAG: terminase large subunit domain-containing protein [Candidatus Thorarchaeota archaeon]